MFAYLKIFFFCEFFFSYFFFQNSFDFESWQTPKMGKFWIRFFFRLSPSWTSEIRRSVANAERSDGVSPCHGQHVAQAKICKISSLAHPTRPCSRPQLLGVAKEDASGATNTYR
jgi:hypothetical protein